MFVRHEVGRLDGLSSDRNPLDFIQRDLIARAVIQFRSSR